ncbi:BED-type domain-containing protein [Caenorhabditis elegans]|uniref:BED-type domain-containing protein n=1 Tax=Caenorhabditis elegans TaxID=6239 RepID=G4SI18_CAEEL|nr:BED-type domain-containing protein [Caenorhabditis elegans]CCD70995.2 BED-type domain-containing protein [Caenorhabditis elegans]|eukprot:NP_001263833.1 Uncharacterized protein CELE_F41B5.1 [Caenorhabditis elegans]
MSSKVWLFFDGRNTGNDAKCSLCGSIIKKTKSGSTSPQIAHLKTFHGEEWSRALGKETSSSREISVEKDPEPAENNDDETTRMAPVFWQRKKTQNEQYMDDNSAEARLITTTIMETIAVDTLSLNTTESCDSFDLPTSVQVCSKVSDCSSRNS